jgi:hypothetical protein
MYSLCSLIESANLSGLNQQRYLTDVPARSSDYPTSGDH